MLTAPTLEDRPTVLRDRFSNFWNRNQNSTWDGPELSLFDERPATDNCFYLVLETQGAALDGNVIALTIKGQAATPIGINPQHPPRRWEAWDGSSWRPVLLNEADDQTQGFSFAAVVEQGGNPLQGADVVLHLPLGLPVTQFATYRGHWLRCVCHVPALGQASYSQSPRITGLSVRAIGGTVPARQCEIIRQEVLGESDGSPGQMFRLKGFPVLERQEAETITVTPPSQEPQVWQEVEDFSASGPNDRHYVIDAITGLVQFGPRVREPSQLRQRSELQTRFLAQSGEANPLVAQLMVSPEAGRDGLSLNALQTELRSLNQLERQYGAIPPQGAVVRMAQYRTGGGQQGNVQAQALTMLKSAVPYVASVTNHSPARHGADAESLEQAAMRVPQLLRTRNRAVTVEDFEYLALQGGQGAVARAHCLPPDQPGVMKLVLIPHVNLDLLQQGQGLAPERFALTPSLQRQVLEFLDKRRLLGTQIQCQEPDFVGVTVQTEIALDPTWRDPEAQTQILRRLQTMLYQFLNPITGGRNQQGWLLGQVLYQSDIVSLLQSSPGIRYLGAVQLFKWQRQGERWLRLPPSPSINPGLHGVICSWQDPVLNSGHTISVVMEG
ncbi:MAG TPA: putative baseplate assembly protein [Trichocoleus sp.]